MRAYKKQQPKSIEENTFTKLTFTLIAVEFNKDIENKS